MAWDKKGWTGGRIWIGKDGEKTYYIWKMVRGRRYNVSTKTHTERDAFRHLDKFEADPAAYMESLKTVVLSDELIERYAKHMEDNLRGRPHINKTKNTLKELRLTFPGDLKQITRKDMSDWYVKSGDRGKKMGLVKTFWRWAVETGLLSQDVVSHLKPMPSRPAQETKTKVIPQNSHEAVVEQLRKSKPHYADAMVVLAGTGWHVSELLRLSEIRMLRDAGENRKKWAEKNPFVLKTVHKSGAIHQTLVGKTVVEAAIRLKERMDTKGFDRVRFYKAVKAACVALGIEQITPGTYRHSVATKALEAGVSPEKVAAFLGHRSSSTTRRFYAVHAVVPKVPTLE
jgi:integrase